jgi:hypothetical protein
VSDQSDRKGNDQLERINAQLTASLKSCRAILRDCHRRLAANSNELNPDRPRSELDLS